MWRRNGLVNFVLFFICSACSDNSEFIHGKWVNISFDSIDDIIYNFQENGIHEVLNYDRIKDSRWEIENDFLRITTPNGNSNRYELNQWQDDVVEISNNEGRKILVQTEHLNKFLDSDVSDLRNLLISTPWKLDYHKEDGSNYIVEFLSSGKLLFNHKSSDSTDHIRSIDWEILKIDSLLFLTLFDVSRVNILITNYNERSTEGLRLVGDGIKKITLERKEISPSRLHSTQRNLAGEWVNINRKYVPFSISFYFNRILNEYESFDKEFGGHDSGTFQVSTDGRLILLNRLKNYNQSIVRIVSLNQDTLKVKFGFTSENEQIFIKNHDAVLF